MPSFAFIPIPIPSGAFVAGGVGATAGWFVSFAAVSSEAVSLPVVGVVSRAASDPVGRDGADSVGADGPASDAAGAEVAAGGD